MSFRLGGFSSYALPAFAVVLFAVFLSVALAQLAIIERDMRKNVDENMLWVVTQAQVASHRLDQAVHRYTLDDDAARPDQRFDVLVSRLSLMDAGPQRRYLDRIGMGKQFDGVSTALDDIERRLETLAPGHEAAADAIHAEMEPLMNALNRVANAVMVEEWETTGERLDTHHHSLMLAIAMMVGILVSGVLLTTSLLMALRQRRAAEQALTEHRDRLEIEVKNRTRDLETERRRVVDAIETAPDGFAAFDANERLTLVNPRMSRLVPLSQEMLRPGRALDHVLDGIWSTTRPVNPCAGGGRLDFGDERPQDLEVPWHGWVQVTLRRTGHGGAVLRVADITSYMESARRLSNSLERERGVSELYRSFAAVASHQFRTPLAVIDSGLQRLERVGESMGECWRIDRYRQLREVIAQMDRLVEDGLRSARWNHVPDDSTGSKVDLREIAEQAVSIQRRITPGNPIRVHAEPDGPLLCGCDGVLVEQIFVNLLSNAGKYSSAGGTIRVILRSESDAVFCSVVDEGIGVPEEDIPRLFDRFYRARNATEHGGVGLGLGIARRLARIEGGDLLVRSREGYGSTFTLVLPRDGRDDARDRGDHV